MLNKLSKNIRFDNASKGFDPTEGGVGRYIVLTISELCEGQNELRDGHGITEVYYSGGYTDEDGATHPATKPEGFPVEIADAIIRLLDIAGKFNFDLEAETDTQAADYSDSRFTIDDWILGAINIISMMGSYEPAETDFQIYLREGLATLFLLCETHNIPVMSIINKKLAFNRSRPPKHGRKF